MEGTQVTRLPPTVPMLRVCTAPMVWAADGRTIVLPILDLRPFLVLGQAEHINIHGDVVGLDKSVAAVDNLMQSRVAEKIRPVGRLSGGFVVTTTVAFVELTPQMIEWYVGTGEARDKAGAYGMQGMAGLFADRIEGSVTNVIGLPMAETLAMLRVVAET